MICNDDFGPARHIVAGTGDWGWNNWRAGRERAASGRFRYYIWDAEWALGFYGRTVDINSFSNELASGSSEMGALYHDLIPNSKFIIYEKAGHMLPWEQAGDLSHEIAAFCK